MRREVAKATATGLVVTLGLAALVVIGSRRLAHFDAALVAYTFATLFAAFGVTYRYSMWLQRPPTAMYWRRGWQTFFRRGFTARNLAAAPLKLWRRFVLNDFIFKRGITRGLAHWLIMWGCVLAAAITFPLVFGWIHFITLSDDLTRYRIMLFGFPTIVMRTDSVFAFLIFHGLVWASLLVIPGVMLAMRRRMREHGEATAQSFGEDMLPLIALFAISITGILLWVSYRFMHGYAYEFLAIFHAVTVIFTLLYLPFGKFFHIFQRPAQIGVSFYKDVGAASEQAHCRRCGEAFASKMHVEDLITVERQLGYRYDMQDGEGHYQWICPRCRRQMLGIAQGRLWAPEPTGMEAAHG